MADRGAQAPYVGSFEDMFGNPDWNGWTSQDLTARDYSAWHADTLQALSGNYSAWCGEYRFESCGENDPAGGYGNAYDENLEWRVAVADANLPTTVRVRAKISYDLEPGYDYCFLSIEDASANDGHPFENVWSATDLAVEYQMDETFTYPVSAYGGEGNDEIAILFRVVTDYSWSDADCMWPTGGAMRIDDLEITTDNGPGIINDFEDGTLGCLTPKLPRAVGDFAALRSELDDGAPCGDNQTPQVTFLDDGLVVPGTGGTTCQTWCYGPDGYVVNVTGGVAGPERHLANSVLSPVMVWPDPTHDAGTVSATIYSHNLVVGFELFGATVRLHVRSTSSNDPEGIESQTWRELPNYMFGDASYDRIDFDIGPLIVPDTKYFQVRLTAYDLKFTEYSSMVLSSESSPGPYLDDVRLATHHSSGPKISVLYDDLAVDNFPENGVLDLTDPGSNHVRFDSAYDDQSSSPDDQLNFRTSAGRAGALLSSPPLMHYRLNPNPVFDPYRTTGLPEVGSVVCVPNSSFSNPITGIEGWSVDLPDSHFLFPGDVLQYYFSATETVGGNILTAVLPPDTTGFGDFSKFSAFDDRFVFHALPSLGPGPESQQPSLLLWVDANDDPAEVEVWLSGLKWCGLEQGLDFDVMRTPRVYNEASLGIRATLEQISGYQNILYTSGKAEASLYNDINQYPQNSDIYLLDEWLRLGGRNAVFFGDNILSGASGDGIVDSFMSDWLGAGLVGENLGAVVGEPVDLVVDTWLGDGTQGQVADRLETWLVEGGCPGARKFDCLEATVGASVLAEFLRLDLSTRYGFGAGILNEVGDFNAKLFTFPFGLSAVDNFYAEPNGGPSTVPAGWRLISDILGALDYPIDDVASATDIHEFKVRCFPNPFNASVSINYSIGRPGHLVMKVYDLKGSLVKTLVDRSVETGERVLWDGRDSRGSSVASGIYFYKATMGDEVRIGKLMLVK